MCQDQGVRKNEIANVPVHAHVVVTATGNARGIGIGKGREIGRRKEKEAFGIETGMWRESEIVVGGMIEEVFRWE